MSQCNFANFWVNDVSVPIEKVDELFLGHLTPEQKCTLMQGASLAPEYLEEVKSVQQGLPVIDRLVIQMYTQMEGGYTPMNLLARHGDTAASEWVRQQGRYPFWEVYQYPEFWTDQLKEQLPDLFTDATLVDDLDPSDPADYDWEKEEDDVYKRITDDFLVYTIDWVNQQLSRVISQMPPLPQQCIVFRGVRTNLFLDDDEYEARGFTSVSNNPESARAFHTEDGTNYLYRMILPEQANVMPMRDRVLTLYAESEIVLPNGVRFTKVKEIDMQGVVLVDVDVDII